MTNYERVIRFLVTVAVFVSLVCWLAGCNDTVQPTVNPVADPAPAPLVETTGPIVFVGDSLFANWRAGFAQTTVTLTDEISNSVNTAIVGQTTAQMRARFSQVLALHPSVVVILGGANDLRLIADPSIDDIAWMAEQASAAGARVVLCTVPPGDWWRVSTVLTQNDNQEQTKAWNQKIAFLASAYGYHVADFYWAMLDPAGDGLDTTLFYPPPEGEPNNAGYAVMLPILEQAIYD